MVILDKTAANVLANLDISLSCIVYLILGRAQIVYTLPQQYKQLALPIQSCCGSTENCI